MTASTATVHPLDIAERELHRINFLPLVKAYPALSKRYGEVSCVAGAELRDEGPRWVRLYPVPFRALDSSKQFAKYQPMSLEVQTHSGDTRPETRRPNTDSIRLLGGTLVTKNDWAERKPFVEPLITHSMCDVQRRQKTERTSLAAFRPARVVDLIIEPASVKEEKQAIADAWAAQGTLLDASEPEEKSFQVEALELMPWTFKYRYFCADPACKGHTQSIIDWEISQLYRNVKRNDDWQDAIRKKWLDQMCGQDRDTVFFVGNQHLHPGSFLILGVWWPRRVDQLQLI